MLCWSCSLWLLQFTGFSCFFFQLSAPPQIQFFSRIVSGMWWEHVQTDRVRCSSERSSLQLGFNMLFVFIAKSQPWLISSKSSLLRALCWLGHLSSFFCSLLTLPVANCCFEIWASLSVGSYGQTQDNEGQKFSFTACGSSKFGVLRKEVLHNWFFCALVLFPLTFSVDVLGWWTF